MLLEEIISGLRGDAPVRGVWACAHWTLVASRGWGMASTLVPEAREVPPWRLAVRDAGRLTEKGARELAAYALSENPLEASIGMAALNSLLEPNQRRCQEANALEVLASRSEGREVVVVGHFPFVAALRKVARALWVVERRPLPGDLPEEAAERVVPQAEVVAITGSTFINHTIDRLLELCRPEAFVMIVGPTSPFSEALFDHGVDAIAGSQVVDPEAVLRHVAEGATFRQLRGVRHLVMWRG